MKYFNNCKSIEDLKKEYKKLAFANHPDRNGDLEVMKAINVEYEEALNNLKMNGSKADKESTEVASEFIEIINNIINLEGLVIEIVGNWIWITGNTKEHKEVLKANGFYYASKKKAWYLKPNDYAAKSRKHYSLDEIKSKYGSTKVETGTKKNYKKLA
jgi:hypothetical protein